MRAKTTSFTFAVCDGLKIQHMHDYSDSHGPRVQQVGYRDVRGGHLVVMPLVKYKQCIVIHVLNL
jgi:hypothetical protein